VPRTNFHFNYQMRKGGGDLSGCENLLRFADGKPVCLVSYELFIFSVLDMVLRDPVFVLDFFLCSCLDVSVKLNGHGIVSSIRFSFWSWLGVQLQEE
jgi:hypothetical protein